MNIIGYYSTNNDCYKNNVNKADSRYTTFQSRGPIGLMLHSVGCSQPNAKVFANQWNKSGVVVAVHAVLQADGTVYQCLPWTYRGWHAGGSANNTHVGVEMTEPSQIKYTSGSSFIVLDKEAAQAQVRGTYNTAVQLFAQLCTQFGLNPMTDIISHSEGYKKGVATNHGDPEHLWRGVGLNYTMDTFRAAVKAAMGGKNTEESKPAESHNGLQVGDTMHLMNGATYIGGTAIPSWVIASELFVREIRSNGDIVFSIQRTGAVTGVVSTKYVVEASSNSLPYLVKVTTAVLNVRKGPSTGYAVATQVKNGEVYTIVEEKNGWGRLKSGAGWICLDYTKKI